MSEVWELEVPIQGIYSHGGPFVYFAQEFELEDIATEPLKIGVAAWPKKRLATLQTGNSRRLVLRQLIIGGTAAETRLHRVWRRKGAWIRDERFGKGHQIAILALAYEIATRQVEAIEVGRSVDDRVAGCIKETVDERRAA